MKLVRLTDLDGEDVFINPDYIVRTRRDLGNTTMIILAYGYSINVKEQQEDIKQACEAK